MYRYSIIISEKAGKNRIFYLNQAGDNREEISSRSSDSAPSFGIDSYLRQQDG
jgi:hypothetical protein